MSHSHRGVPPLAAITLPSPPSQQPPTSLGQLPHTWQQNEDMMRVWYQAKMEEDRREQERERTRQEHQRTETRRVELEMLREAFNHGVPPSLIPLMFVGPGALASSSEWMQEYTARNLGIALQQAQHGPHGQRQIQQAPSESPAQPALRRETRSIQSIGQVSNPGPQMAPPTGAATQQPYVSTYQLPGTGNLAVGQPATRPSTQSGAAPPPPPPRTSLPRINTANELQFQQVQPSLSQNIVQMAPPGVQSVRGSSQSHAPHQAEVSQSPSIFFHHWVPPGTQSGSGGGSGGSGSGGGGSGGGKESGAGSGGGGGGGEGSPPQRQLDSPFTHQPPSNPVTSSDYSNSPKKRKSSAAQGQQPPPPTSQPFSPQPQTASSPAITPSRTRRGHARHRSNENSSRGHEVQRLTRQVHRRSIGAGDTPEGSSQNPGPHTQPQPPYQRSPTTSAEEPHRGSQSAGSTPSHYHAAPPRAPPQEEQHRQQSVPPPQHPPPPPRPYSAGSDFRDRRIPYPPPSLPNSNHALPLETDDRDRK